MFAIHFRRIYHVCDKVVIRNIRGGRRSDFGPNPGLDRRIKAFQEDGLRIEDNDAEEFIEQSDSSFQNVGQAYEDHLNETSIGKQKLRHHIVKERYFKDNLPNLLTWSEKEQIRYLATEQPDEWPPEKIAESFPVTVHTVKKLLKFPWKPASEQRIARHDASAMRNWRELKEGTIEMPESLREHFLKFSDRSIPPLNRKSIKDDLTQEEKLGEFARIVQKCAEESEKKLNNTHEEDNSDSDTEYVNVVKDNKITTLAQLTDKIKKRMEVGGTLNLPDKIMFDTVTLHHTEVTKQNNIKDIELYQDKSNNEETSVLAEYKKNELQVFSGSSYPQRIRVPKKAYKRGATYKVNDCFYDDDGRFLYRVIGMTKN